jgi:hypothetical protein
MPLVVCLYLSSVQSRAAIRLHYLHGLFVADLFVSLRQVHGQLFLELGTDFFVLKRDKQGDGIPDMFPPEAAGLILPIAGKLRQHLAEVPMEPDPPGVILADPQHFISELETLLTDHALDLCQPRQRVQEAEAGAGGVQLEHVLEQQQPLGEDLQLHGLGAGHLPLPQHPGLDQRGVVAPVPLHYQPAVSLCLLPVQQLQVPLGSGGRQRRTPFRCAH